MSDSKTWMADLPPALLSKPLTALTLPGSHDSGAYKFTTEVLDPYQTPGIKAVQDAAIDLKNLPGMSQLAGLVTSSVLDTAVRDWGLAQTLTLREQLENGIRWLDLRTMSIKQGIFLFHGYAAIPVGVGIKQVKAFISDWPKEVVVLYFSHMSTLSVAEHMALGNIIESVLGVATLCSSADLGAKSLQELQTQGTRVVVFYDHWPSSSPCPFAWMLDQKSFYQTPSIEADSVGSLVSQLNSAIMAGAGGLPFNAGFTTTPATADIIWSIVNQLNLFSSKHDLHWFTQGARGALSNWVSANAATSLGIVSTDFVDETSVLQACLTHMGVTVSSAPLSIKLPIGALSTDGGRPYAFVLGSDGHLWQNYWTGSKWQWYDAGMPPQGITVLASLGVLSVAGKRPYAFMLGSNGHLLQNYWDDTSNSWRWCDTGTPSGSVGISKSLGTAMQDGSRPYIFILGTDGQLWQNYWTGSNWAWFCAGQPSASVSVGAGIGTAYCDDRPYVFVRGSDGNLWQNYWTGSNWVWNPLGTPNANTGINMPIGALSVYDGGLLFTNRAYAFMVGSDGQLWQIYWTGSYWTWLCTGTPSPTVGINAPMGTRLTSDWRPCVFVLGTDGHLWQNTWSGSQWDWYDNGVPTAPAAIGYSVGAVTNDVFVTDGSGRLWRFDLTSGNGVWVDSGT